MTYLTDPRTIRHRLRESLIAKFRSRPSVDR
jgi:hypothetical protein